MDTPDTAKPDSDGITMPNDVIITQPAEQQEMQFSTIEHSNENIRGKDEQIPSNVDTIHNQYAVTPVEHEHANKKKRKRRDDGPYDVTDEPAVVSTVALCCMCDSCCGDDSGGSGATRDGCCDCGDGCCDCGDCDCGDCDCGDCNCDCVLI